MKKIVFIVITALLAGCGVRQESQDQGSAVLFLPDDLEATLWAASPMFYNPTNIDVDARGRIWVTEAVNYRNYNNDSTHMLHHHKGDRVMILEDTDGDGKPDTSKVFVQDKDLVSPLGIAVIENKVYVSCSPNLIVYTDTDGDDRPDEKEIMLTGFGGVDHDHALHAVIGGPDGNLYFNTGNAGPHVVTDKSGWTLRSGSVYTGGSPYNKVNQGNMISDDGKVWVGGLALRMNDRGGHLAVFAHNFRNAYELTVDSRGDLWQNDNDDQVVACRTSWLMEGGNAGYFSADGTRTWQADQRPWQDVFTAHWHQDDPGVMPAGDNAGAGSPTGVVVNESDALGLQHRGMLLSADAGRNVIFGYHPQRKGSGYDLGKRLNFITSLRQDNVGYVWNDSADNQQSQKWFRPSDVAIGTDGAIYIADWYDPIVGGHQMRDSAGYGRIYRITPRGKELKSPTLDMTTREGQLQALTSPAINVRYTALKKLQSAGPEIIPALKEMTTDENPYHRARAVWLLSRLGNEGIAEVEALLEHHDEAMRIVAFRALRKDSANILRYAEKLGTDPSAFVRREVITALGGLPFEKTKNLLLQLAAGHRGLDRWYIESLGTALAGHESEFYPLLLKAYRAVNTAPQDWNEDLAALVWRLHPPDAVQALQARAAASTLSDRDRSAALTALSFIETPSAVQAMIGLSQNPHKVVAEQATYWLSFRQGNTWYALWDWPKSGLDLEFERKIASMTIRRNRIRDPKMPLNEKKNSVRQMARDAVGAPMLLRMVADRELPEALYDFAEENIRVNDDPAVRMQAAAYFRNDSLTAAMPLADITKLQADVNAGKNIFETRCATCHRAGKSGADIGPDLTAIKTKFDRETLLDAIVHPDAGIVFGYEVWTVNLKNGQSYFGFLVADGAQTITIKDLAGKNHVVPANEVVSRKKQDHSLMPTPTALNLTAQNLADVSQYLMTLE